jgi:nucleotide-binding universal stress UspA family protein
MLFLTDAIHASREQYRGAAMTLTHEPVAVSIDTILLATDLSGTSERAAAYARAIARRFGSTLDMIHVVDPSALAICDEVVFDMQQKKLHPDTATSKPEPPSFVEFGVTTRSFTAEGHDAAQTLLELAHQRHSDLIVAGTQAKTGMGRLILGSTAEKLIRNANCPVLTIGPNAVAPPADSLAFRCIVYATDFSPQAAKAALHALALAESNRARLCCCFVEEDELQDPAVRAERTRRFTRELHQALPENHGTVITPEFFVERGRPAEAILRLARRVRADLIVLGPRKSSFWLNYVDHGTTPELLAEATCPVLTIC